MSALAAGATAPQFRLPRLEGGDVRLADLLAEGPVILAFFKVSCPVCQFTFPFLQRIHGSSDRGTPRLVGVSQDDPATTREFNAQAGVTFPTLLDDEPFPVSNGFGLTNVPTLFLVEQDRTVSWTTTGFHKADLQALGEKLGTQTFRDRERVPAWKPG